MQIRDRIKDFRRVKASELRPNPKNWRTHSTAQQDALRGVLAEVGYADAVLVRELEDGALQLIDGHLRVETTPDAIIPVLLLDVNEAEADYILLTHDPLSGMAGGDGAKLEELLEGVSTNNPAVEEMLSQLEFSYPPPAPTSGEETKTTVSFETGGASSYKEQYGVMIECTDEGHQMLVHEWCLSQGYKCKVVTT